MAGKKNAKSAARSTKKKSGAAGELSQYTWHKGRGYDPSKASDRTAFADLMKQEGMKGAVERTHARRAEREAAADAVDEQSTDVEEQAE